MKTKLGTSPRSTSTADCALCPVGFQGMGLGNCTFAGFASCGDAICEYLDAELLRVCEGGTKARHQVRNAFRLTLSSVNLNLDDRPPMISAMAAHRYNQAIGGT